MGVLGSWRQCRWGIMFGRVSARDISVNDEASGARLTKIIENKTQKRNILVELENEKNTYYKNEKP